MPTEVKALSSSRQLAQFSPRQADVLEHALCRLMEAKNR